MQNIKIKYFFIVDIEKWLYLAVKNIYRLLYGVTQKNNEERYSINFLHSFRTESKLKSHENVSNNHKYCHV